MRYTAQTLLQLLILIAFVLVLYKLQFLMFKDISLQETTVRLNTAHRKPTGFNYSDTSYQRFGPELELPDQHITTFTLTGYVFDDKGVYKNLSHTASTSFLFSFSPQTEKHFRSMMIDPTREHPVYANSPAIVRHNGELLVVMKIWLQKERLKDKEPAKNTFLDNYLYMRKFNLRMEPVSKGGLLDIPTPTQWGYGEGPLEPRLFYHRGRTFLSFNTGVMLNDSRAFDTTYMWNFDTMSAIMPKFEGGAPMERLQANRIIRDKHWIHFSDKSDDDPDKLYFTYNLDPLKIMRMDVESGFSEIIYSEGPYVYPFANPKDIVRGGSPFLEYQHPYYISLGHGTMFIEPTYNRIYIGFFLVLRVDRPKYKIVYKSNPLEFHDKILNRFPIVRDAFIKQPFIFPMSMILENEDTCAFGTHVNDYGSVLLRVRGLKQLMKDVMKADKDLPCQGPPVGFLHQFTRKYMSEKMHLKFVSG